LSVQEARPAGQQGHENSRRSPFPVPRSPVLVRGSRFKVQGNGELGTWNDDQLFATRLLCFVRSRWTSPLPHACSKSQPPTSRP